MTAKILVVEDDATLAFTISRSLEAAGLSCNVVKDGKLAAEEVFDQDYGLILLDIGLPGMSGLSVLKKLRSIDDQLPVIIITSNDTSQHELETYNLGANLYHPKPIEFPLLIAQVRNLVRLSNKSTVITLGDLVIDMKKRTVMKAGELIKLTYKEFELLRLLASKPGNTFTREQIMMRTFKSMHDIEQGTIDTLVSRTRRKLGKYRGQSVIETVHAVGFRLNHIYLQVA